MPTDTARIRRFIREFDFKTLFIEELGWNHFRAGPTEIALDGITYVLTPVAEKSGFQVFECSPDEAGNIPDRTARGKIERQVARLAFEHLIVFTNRERTVQTWQWARRETGKPLAVREVTYTKGQTAENVAQKVAALAVSFEEEETIALPDVTRRVRGAFDVDRVTKRFYDRFKTEHTAFLKFVVGIREQGDREWYASLMLNRLMFVYFIQKKGFLDGDLNYLRNRMGMMQARRGENQFLSFYRHFLLRLFHEGLGQPKHTSELDALLGRVPYLNGGLFDVHELERDNLDIQIADEAFERLFDFFDAYQWHLDERPLRADNEINPDVLGYIFEKYINQKQMGAYYTKEDITEYISKNTIVPFLFDAAEKKCAIAFRPDSAVWGLLRENPDRYMYEAVRKGVDIGLPPQIEAGLNDVSKREGWNRPADPEYALPTETWREHVARRQRCQELRVKLAAGEVHSIDDLITYNLDIRQFAQDVIQGAEGPELVRAFYQSIEEVTILDPTCGSGAFLFAALNILEPLYEACLERMQAFVEDLDRSGEQHRPEKFRDFRTILGRVAQHPNRRYFILKSIIIGNLYGVDIMEEAVEICKLRLFLKLVAQLERVEEIEPLPDIDFNIRSGNTLVGSATYEEVRKAVLGDVQGKLDLAGDMARIDESAEIADRAFRQFREMQTEQSMEAEKFSEAKRVLRQRLAALSEELDRYLASQHGIDRAHIGSRSGYEAQFVRWREGHQPFHWFAEFYGIMHGGGFDVIIGNPPYIELKTLTQYDLFGYDCLDAGNLYALVMERSSRLCNKRGRQGFIVPVSSVSTDRYDSLQHLISQYQLHYSSFDDRPSRLFDGLEHIRLTIHLIGVPSQASCLFSTRYNKWTAAERKILFESLRFVSAKPELVKGALPKLSSQVEDGILNKLRAQHIRLSTFYNREGEYCIFYSRKVGYFLQVVDFEPIVLDGKGNRRPPSEFKRLCFATESYAKVALCCLNSNLFYWFVTVFSDCRHVNKREVDAFPVHISNLAASEHGALLRELANDLMTDLEKNSIQKKMSFKHDTLTVQCIFPKQSKPLIDDIDRILARYFGFTDEELDFIINYDIKYRMGREAEE